jgi:two-component system CheB/CheR fusion protein
LVGADGRLLVANRQAGELFGIDGKDVGRPLRDLEVSYRPVEFHSPLEEVLSSKEPVEIRDVAWRTRDGKPLALNVRLTRLGAADGDGAVAVAFADMSETNQLQQDLETSNQELETAMEELQSTNEELQTVNQELHERTAELGDTNSFMSSILGSVRVGVVVLDENLRVQVWSPRAQDLWGLRADEVVVQSLMSLEIGLPLDPVRELIRRTLPREHGHEVIEVDAANRRGRGIQVRITCSRLQPEGGNGVILLMEDLSAGS